VREKKTTVVKRGVCHHKKKGKKGQISSGEGKEDARSEGGEKGATVQIALWGGDGGTGYHSPGVGE